MYSLKLLSSARIFTVFNVRWMVIVNSTCPTNTYLGGHFTSGLTTEVVLATDQFAQNGHGAVWTSGEDAFHSSDIQLHLNFRKPNFLLDQYSQYRCKGKNNYICCTSPFHNHMQAVRWPTKIPLFSWIKREWWYITQRGKNHWQTQHLQELQPVIISSSSLNHSALTLRFRRSQMPYFSCLLYLTMNCVG